MPAPNPNISAVRPNSLFMVSAANPILTRSRKAMRKHRITNGMRRHAALRDARHAALLQPRNEVNQDLQQQCPWHFLPTRCRAVELVFLFGGNRLPMAPLLHVAPARSSARSSLQLCRRKKVTPEPTNAEVLDSRRTGSLVTTPANLRASLGHSSCYSAPKI